MPNSKEIFWQLLDFDSSVPVGRQSDWEGALDLLNEHGLSGLVSSRRKADLPTFASDCLKVQLSRQRQRNLLQYQELRSISNSLKAESTIRPVILKGMALLPMIYEEVGERHMSDIDLLVEKDEVADLISLLSKQGFRSVPTRRWWGNSFKWELSKETDCGDVNIEVHSNLFYGTNSGWWHKEAASHLGDPCELSQFDVLCHEEMFVHLCGHLAYQHTFLKLSWLVDLVLFLKKYRESMDWQRVYQIANDLGMKNSCAAVLHAVGAYSDFAVDIPDTGNERLELGFAQRLITRELLLEPHANLLRYYCIKHLLKDKVSTALRYDLRWLISKLN